MYDFSALDYVTSGVCIIDESFTVVFWNTRLEEWTRKKRQSTVGRPLQEVFPGFSEPAYKKRIEGLFQGGPPVLFSSELHPGLFRGLTPKGEKAVQQATVSACPAGDNRYYALFSIEDITALYHKIRDYRAMSSTARAALEEKDVLFREMHHRVHNNLNTVLSLINLKISSDEDYDRLQDLKSQVNAIRLVHEKLYRGKDAMNVEFGSYLREMLDAVLGYHVDVHAELDIDVPDVPMTTIRAIPLGLIINEIVINSLKHGFSNRRGRITIRLDKDDTEENYVLTVGNDGPPLPEHIGLDNPGTLGLRLIVSLTEQLGGTIELTRTPHPVYMVRFPVDES